jgi:N-acetylneuraminate synthase
VSVLIVAEVGINANGSVDLAKQLIHVAKQAGADYVKFQKRTIDLCYTPLELSKLRESPFGSTNGDLKRGLEFSPSAYDQIDAACQREGIRWTASAWDATSIDFINYYKPDFLKIPSALLTAHYLLRWYARTGRNLVLSTGMSTLDEIRSALLTLDPEMSITASLMLLACTSTYPCPLEEVNLRQIETLRDNFDLPIGFSSHTTSPWPCLGAVALGAGMIEAHITLDRTMFGSDQAASLEPQAFTKLCTEIRDMEKALGDGKKVVWPSEVPIREKLRYNRP